VDGFLPGDFDGDDDQDLAAVDAFGGVITLLVNDGDAVFGKSVTFQTGGPSINSIDAADMDGDQDLDIVLILNTDTGQRIFIGFNDGSGGAAGNIPVGTGTRYFTVTAADVDGDDDVDLIASTFDASVEVLRNNGDATFAEPEEYLLADSTGGIQILDINGDDRPEIAAVVNELVTILPNNGDGTFGAARRLGVADDFQAQLLAADLDLDGDRDLAAFDRFTEGTALYFNNGSNWFPVDAAYYFDDSFDVVGTGDIDGDGDIDVIAADDSLVVFLNDGGGILTAGTQIDLPGCPEGLSVGRFDATTALDVAVFDECGNSVIVFYNMRGGSPERVDLLFSPADNIAASTTADVNGDDLDDLVLADRESLRIRLATPSGQFAPAIAVDAPQSFIGGIGAARVNGDANVDLIVSGSDGKGGDALSVLFGIGDGTFQRGPLTPVDNAFGSLAAEDLNLDGNVDLVTHSSFDEVLVLFGDGAGNFPQSVVLPLFGNSEGGDFTVAGGFQASDRPVLADVGGDERPDIVVGGDSESRLIHVFLNRTAQPGRTFASAGIYDGVGELESIAAADVDGNGFTDIVAVGFGEIESGVVAVIYNRREIRDCNANGRADDDDIALGSSDCNFNGAPDECDSDCDANGVVDFCDVYFNFVNDCGDDFVPDVCQTDCNVNGLADVCESSFFGSVFDCNLNGIPDDCDIASGSPDADGDGVPDECLRIVFVDDSAPAGGDGNRWATALNRLQDALQLTFNIPQGSRLHIWMAAGVYSPAEFVGDQFSSFNVFGNVNVSGGFAGTEDPTTFNLDDRDFVANETILSGDVAGNDDPLLMACFSGSGVAPRAGCEAFDADVDGDVDGADYTLNPSRSDNSIHVMRVFFSNTPTTLDGLTISGGSAVSPFISVQEARGGGLFAQNADLTIRRCRFVGNFAAQAGGAALLEGTAGMNCSDCEFAANWASSGGALSIRNSSTAFGRGLFSRNYAFGPTDGGGAVATISSPFTGFGNCRFFQNLTDAGAGGGGGAISTAGGFADFANSLFVGNVANGVGGLGGAAIANGSIAYSNCTITQNRASTGGGHAQGANGPSVAINNSILWDNADSGAVPGAAQIHVGVAGDVTVTFSNIQGGFTGTGNLDADPLFVDAAGPDAVLGTADDDLRLTTGSPCINAADANLLSQDSADLDDDGDIFEKVSLDLDGNARVIGPEADMGAYENPNG